MSDSFEFDHERPEPFELRLADELGRYAATARDPRTTADVAATAMAARRRWWSVGARPRHVVPVVLLAVLTTVAVAVGGRSLLDRVARQDAVQGTPMVDMNWVLRQSVADGRLAPVGDSLSATLRISGQNADGKLDCRGYVSHVAIDGPSIVFRDVAPIVQSCPASSAALESDYLANLGRVALWSVADGTLTLSDPAPPVDLADSWTVAAVSGADGQQIAMSPLGILFAGGRITSTTECNVVTGRYAQAAADIRITDVTAAGICPEQPTDDDALRAALEASVRVDSDGDLVLLLDGRGTARVYLSPTRPPGTPVPASS